MLETLPPEEAPSVEPLPEHLLFIMRAFDRLRHDRPWTAGGMGAPIPGRIPWRLVMDYAAWHGYPQDMAALLDSGIQCLDTVWLEYFETERQRAAKK